LLSLANVHTQSKIKLMQKMLLLVSVNSEHPHKKLKFAQLYFVNIQILAKIKIYTYFPRNTLVIDPKYPATGVIPFAFWKRMIAARVKLPNVVVSFPREPGPDDAIINP